jgi:hypothetical protein
VAERIANSEAEALGNPVKAIDKAYAINFAMFEKYPHDILKFSGSHGYRTVKDDTPADHEQVKPHVAADRWRPAGSSAEERDLNAPSARTCAESYGLEDCHPRIRGRLVAASGGRRLGGHLSRSRQPGRTLSTSRVRQRAPRVLSGDCPPCGRR